MPCGWLFGAFDVRLRFSVLDVIDDSECGDWKLVEFDFYYRVGG